MSLLEIVSIALHFCTFVLCCIGFFAPFWYVELNSLEHVGLWARCKNEELTCIWFFERDYAWERSLPGWHKAAQVLYSVGIVVLFVTFTMTIAHYIFSLCKKKIYFPIVIGTLVLISMVFDALSVTVFGIAAYKDEEVSINSWVARFEWSFFIAIAGICLCVFVATLYIADGVMKQKRVKGYQSTANA